MPHYMFQGSYTTETWARLSRSPEDRAAAVRPIFERSGGRLESLYFTFGQDDFVAIGELPDNVTAAALALAVASSGAIRNIRTTPLLTPEEGMEAMRRSGQAGYRPPGS